MKHTDKIRGLADRIDKLESGAVSDVVRKFADDFANDAWASLQLVAKRYSEIFTRMLEDSKKQEDVKPEEAAE